jgi:hypothetical protein
VVQAEAQEVKPTTLLLEQETLVTILHLKVTTVLAEVVLPQVAVLLERLQETPEGLEHLMTFQVQP